MEEVLAKNYKQFSLGLRDEGLCNEMLEAFDLALWICLVKQYFHLDDDKEAEVLFLPYSSYTFLLDKSHIFLLLLYPLVLSMGLNYWYLILITFLGGSFFSPLFYVPLMVLVPLLV